ncbi:MAG TPA: hypothetical protein VIU38_04100 [Anaerolineales bacterium]
MRLRFAWPLKPLESALIMAAALLVITVLSYGLFFWQLGFYWDDQPMSWVRYQFGPAAMRLYFSRSRPVWGQLYQITTWLLPRIPAYWQAFALLWRWITALACWATVRAIWPEKPRVAAIVAFLFLLYPGFNLQWVSYLSSHFFIVLTFFLFSLLLMLLALRRPATYWAWTIAALIFSALNLRMLEYFFFLELIRPFVLGAYFAQRKGGVAVQAERTLALEVFKRWLPFLLLWIADVAYRALVFSNQAYENALLVELASEPLASGSELVSTVLSNLWLVVARAWGLAFHFPNPAAEGVRTTLLYLGVLGFVAAVAGYLLLSDAHKGADRRIGFWLIALGVVGLLTGGFSYWLAKVVLTLGFPATRFTISFMLGASLLIAGALELLPRRAGVFVAVVLIGLGAGRQALWAESFRHDWIMERNMFWQMIWRAPGLLPNTTVLMNEGALRYAADNSIGAALNSIYDPENRSAVIHYVLYFPTNRVGRETLPGLEPGLPVKYDNFLIGSFRGSTSQVVSFYFQPPGCMRLLDPDFDGINRLIPESSRMREAALLSSDKWVSVGGDARMPDIYGPEPPHGWCYYFERASLAAQRGTWHEVAGLGDKAFVLEDHPNDPTERFVFIEGYAHTDNWERAIQLSEESYQVSRPYVGPLICALWQRIENETVASEESAHAINEIKSMVACKRE